ncbi:MAG: sulfatase-like hydrolase/transferase [Pirellulaceae bacterium]
MRPHVRFVAPKICFALPSCGDDVAPEKVAGDWDDIPKAGINYKTSVNMKMDRPKQRKAIVEAYYASSRLYGCTEVGRCFRRCATRELEDNTIVIFTSDHGYHLSEHDFGPR